MGEILKHMNEYTTDLPEGFKMTELGQLPEEWEVVKLGDILSEVDVRVKDTNLINIPVLSITRHHGLILQKDKFKKRVSSRDIRRYKVVKKGQIVYGFPMEEGVIFALERFNVGAVSPVYEVWEPNTKLTDVKFLDYLLKTPAMIAVYESLTSKTVQRRRIVSREDFKLIRVGLPPLSEQRAISRVLRTVQRSKEATERVVQATRNLKKSLMRHLFTYGPVPVEEVEKIPLKETEIGLVPEHWDMSRIGEVAFVKGGKRLPKGHNFSEHPTRYPYIRVVDFKNGSVDKANLKFLTPQDYEAIKRYTISSRDVYISIAGTIGLVGIVPLELDGANLTENAAKIVFKDQNQIDQRFVVYFLSSKSGQEQISMRTTKTSQPKLALARIKQIPIPLPPLSEQIEIACILDKVDKKIQTEEARKQALDALFKTLLHHLMTGKIRVKVTK